MPIDNPRSAEHQLFNTGTLVPFRVLDTQTEITPDKENLFVRVELNPGGADRQKAKALYTGRMPGLG
ncbi:MAG: hypothetical protein VBE63_22880 [Lamprobacter sp.]|uniref:hypothetical protein n=1 Tax=Lamprobacter sp. TaxID=3100796 RepID=UPI002B260DED|nr:hypothetical protein [Lamprobacter sp.]MEA3642759.1 hypothetical protein [Lamprobacter sp.]